MESHADQDSRRKERFGERPLSPALLERVFHQPTMIYFNEVAETLSVREGARRLNVASSAVSRQIAQLEEALSLELFERKGRTLKLTAAGEILHRHMRQIAAPLEAAMSELDMLRGLRTGTVRIATVESACQSFLPSLISDFADRYPKLHIDLSVTSSADVVSLVLDDRVDIGIGFLSRPNRHLHMSAGYDVRVGALMRAEHDLAQVERFTLSGCANYPLAVGKPELSIRSAVQAGLEEAGIAGQAMLEVGSIQMLIELALLGRHIAITTSVGAQGAIARGELVFRHFDDAEQPVLRFGLMKRADAELRFAPGVFYEQAKASFNDSI